MENFRQSIFSNQSITNILTYSTDSSASTSTPCGFTTASGKATPRVSAGNLLRARRIFHADDHADEGDERDADEPAPTSSDTSFRMPVKVKPVVKTPVMKTNNGMTPFRLPLRDAVSSSFNYMLNISHFRIYAHHPPNAVLDSSYPPHRRHRQ